MMWIFEWDILTGDSAVLDIIYSVSRGPARRGDRRGRARRSRPPSGCATWSAAPTPPPGATRTCAQHFVDTLDYQVNLLEMLAAYRTMVLRHAQWLDTGSDGRPRRLGGGAGPVRRRGRRPRGAVRRRRRPAGVQPDRRAARRGAGRPRPADGLAGPRRPAAAAVALLAPGPHRSHAWSRTALTPWREPATGRPLALARRDPARRGAVEPAGAHLVPRPGAPAAGRPRLGGPGAGRVAATRVRGGSPPPSAGAVTLRALLLLAVLAVRGPGRLLVRVLDRAGLRARRTSSCRSCCSAGCSRAWCGRSPARPAGAAPRPCSRRRRRRRPCSGSGLLLAAVGLEDALTVWNDQLALLPWGLSRILGITVYLGIPVALPWYLVGAGAVLGAARSRSGCPGVGREPLGDPPVPTCAGRRAGRASGPAGPARTPPPRGARGTRPTPRGPAPRRGSGSRPPRRRRPAPPRSVTCDWWEAQAPSCEPRGRLPK